MRPSEKCARDHHHERKTRKRAIVRNGKRVRCVLHVARKVTYLPTLTSVLGAAKMTLIQRKRISKRDMIREKTKGASR